MRDFEEMNYKLKHIDEKILRNEKEIGDLKKRIEKQDIEGEKERLEEFISENLNVNLIILKDGEDVNEDQ